MSPLRLCGHCIVLDNPFGKYTRICEAWVSSKIAFGQLLQDL
uniref:Uncharacterized protein n=1 Tax=Anguilla anguilla TaxID=7936 RepID=A0A0E9VZ79_ANGAN